MLAAIPPNQRIRAERRGDASRQHRSTETLLHRQPTVHHNRNVTDNTHLPFVSSTAVLARRSGNHRSQHGDISITEIVASQKATRYRPRVDCVHAFAMGHASGEIR